MKNLTDFIFKKNAKKSIRQEHVVKSENVPRVTERSFIEKIEGHERVRFVHATSSRFRDNIENNGLKRPDLNSIISDSLNEFCVPKKLHVEIRKAIENVAFGLQSRSTFEGNPIYCAPLHRDYFPMMSGYARAYANGGEFRNICAREITKILKAQGIVVRPQTDYDPVIVIIEFYAEEICSPAFNSVFAGEFATCLNDFHKGVLKPPIPDVRIYADIDKSRIKAFLSVDDYRKYVGSVY